MKVLKNMEASKHKLQATSAHSQMHEAMLFFTPINLFLSACVCVCVCVCVKMLLSGGILCPLYSELCVHMIRSLHYSDTTARQVNTLPTLLHLSPVHTHAQLSFTQSERLGWFVVMCIVWAGHQTTKPVNGKLCLSKCRL